jgi:uncharacterized membrane protein YeaQ/YmgE (transglycosylase-associated protein family)
MFHPRKGPGGRALNLPDQPDTVPRRVFRLEPEKIMGIDSLLVMLLVGAVAGWLAGKLVVGSGYGLLGNIVIGVLGAVVASFVLPQIGFGLGGGFFSAIIHSTIGAVILLFVIRLIKRV